ncbi:MAG: ArsR/SmtB family transcription factor, partial [Pseudonocardiaceae bacterium]
MDIQKILEALSSPIRREILWLIKDTELPAGAISTAFELTAPTISEHLAVLRGAGLVTVRAAGTYRYYRARKDVLRVLQTLLDNEGAKWTPADDLPERAEATAGTGLVVIASTTVTTDRATTFRGFTEA